MFADNLVLNFSRASSTLVASQQQNTLFTLSSLNSLNSNGSGGGVGSSDQAHVVKGDNGLDDDWSKSHNQYYSRLLTHLFQECVAENKFQLNGNDSSSSSRNYLPNLLSKFSYQITSSPTSTTTTSHHVPGGGGLNSMLPGLFMKNNNKNNNNNSNSLDDVLSVRYDIPFPLGYVVNESIMSLLSKAHMGLLAHNITLAKLRHLFKVVS
jgi:hypothetical protein